MRPDLPTTTFAGAPLETLWRRLSPRPVGRPLWTPPGVAPPLKPAAVLVGILDALPEPAVLLTVRASGLSRHAGQISFPGGRVDPEDADVVATALRETHEETGLAPHLPEIIGFLPDHAVVSGYRVTPVVARLQSLPPLAPAPREVSECFLLPWRFVVDEARHVPVTRMVGGQALRAYDIPYEGRRIWGATAKILRSLREHALPPTDGALPDER